MPKDEYTLGRIRELLKDHPTVTEKPIVGGGIGFMVAGNLCCGLSSRGLTVRLGESGASEALAEPHVKPLEFGGRTADAFVVVAPAGYEADADLSRWVARGLAFVDTLPAR